MESPGEVKGKWVCSSFYEPMPAKKAVEKTFSMLEQTLAATKVATEGWIPATTSCPPIKSK